MNCRHCASGLSLRFLDLGFSPLSNAYLTREMLRAPEMWYPLRILVCENCWLVQAEDYARPEVVFGSDYAYFSSFSTSWLAHAARYVSEMVQRFELNTASIVAEIGANDGYLLQYVKARGIFCYGIEPTASTAAEARRRGIEIIEEFLEIGLAKKLSTNGRQADLIVANNVLAHVSNINDFVAAVAILLKSTGVVTFEFPHLMRMVQERQFDTAYHEHYSYLSLSVVERIFSVAGLGIFDVEELPTHGGSLRVFAQRKDSSTHAIKDRVAAVLSRETAAGVKTPSYYVDFQRGAEQVKDDLLSFLLDAKRRRLKVGAYGAAAKGNTLLNFAGVRPDLLPYVADRNPMKQGKFMPGSRIPICPEEHLQADRPDRILILPWNIKEEVTAQLGYALNWGARFVTAVPSLDFVPASGTP